MVKRNIITAIVISLIFIAIIIFPLSLQYLMPNLFYSPPDIFTITEPTQEEFSNSQFQYIVGRATRGKELPDESRNIFACKDSNRDPAYWLVFELPKDKIPSFVKKIIGIEFESLTDGILSKHSHINKGPHNWRDGPLGEQYWDLSDVENGRRFEEGLFYFGIDTTRGKIFLCYWTT
jgi:hypothetical protein